MNHELQTISNNYAIIENKIRPFEWLAINKNNKTRLTPFFCRKIKV